jgi:hypothetical protein
MALRTINLGSVANDGTGDDLREAFEKVIFNFSELDARTPEATTVTNLGTGEGLYASKNDAELQFKSLVGGNNVVLSSDSNELTIDVDAGVTQFVVAADTGSLVVTENTTVTIEGGTLISTTRDGSNIRIDSSALANVEQDTSPRLGGNLNANGYNLGSVGTIDATTVSGLFNGNLTGLVHGIDIRDLNEYREPENSWDFGGVAPTSVNNLWDYLFATVNVDFGSIAGNNVNVSLDLGSINI